MREHIAMALAVALMLTIAMFLLFTSGEFR